MMFMNYLCVCVHVSVCMCVAARVYSLHCGWKCAFNDVSALWSYTGYRKELCFEAEM